MSFNEKQNQLQEHLLPLSAYEGVGGSIKGRKPPKSEVGLDSPGSICKA